MGIPFNTRPGRAEVAFPAFDPESPDKQILESYERIRDLRNWARKHDEQTGSKWSADEEERYFAELGKAEEWVRGTWATTLPGIVAQLSLILHDSHQCDGRSIQVLTEAGLLGLYRSNLIPDGPDKEVIQAALELVHYEWEQALSDYERASVQYRAVVDLQDLLQAVEAEATETPALLALKAKVNELQDLCCDMPQIERLMKTLPFDEEEFATKVGILLQERVDGEALVWLGRDNTFLSTRRPPAQDFSFDAAPTPRDGDNTPSSAVQEAFSRWRDAWLVVQKTSADEGGDALMDEQGDVLMKAKSAAFRDVLAAPTSTAADFIVKGYMELVDGNGPAVVGNVFEPDTDEFADERDNGDAYKRSLYADLDRSDLGCCLLALGRVNFDAEYWVERALATKLPITGLPEIQVGPVDATDARRAREQERLIRLLNFDPKRRAEVAAVLWAQREPSSLEQAA